MRTPDETAGRKGKCPHCGTKVQIPEGSLASGMARPMARPADVSAPPEEKIAFRCQCGRTLRVPANAAGKKGRCPGCGATMTIPQQSTVKASPSPASRPASTESPSTIEFACPSCMKKVRVGAASAGKQGRCPHCKSVIRIPKGRPRTNAPATPSATDGLTPLGDDFSSPGDGLDDLFADLPPPGQALPTAPMGSAPLGGSPLGSKPLGSAGGASPFGGGGSPLNPYASPAAGPMATARTATGHGDKPRRTGLPWDNRERADSPFIGTIKLVLFKPKQAFYLMHRKGGLGKPIQFFVAGTIIGTIFTMVYQLIFDLIRMAPMLGQQGGENPAAFMVGMVVGYIVGAGCGIACGLVFAIIGIFINAGITHGCLYILGGANYPFETTVRVICYTAGATALYQIIPFGSIIGAIAYVVLVVIGLYAAHETTIGRAIAAVLLPVIVFTALIIMAVLALVGGMAAAMQQAG